MARHTETVNFSLRPPVPCCRSKVVYLLCKGFVFFYLDRRVFFPAVFFNFHICPTEVPSYQVWLRFDLVRGLLVL